MRSVIPGLFAVLLVLVLTNPVSAVCLEGSNWTATWTDIYGETSYTLQAPCKVYLGVPFTITASVDDSYYPSSRVGWNWAINDNGSVISGGDFSQINLSNGHWETIVEQTYTGTPIDHNLVFSFTDYGHGSGFHSAAGSSVGGLTVDPYLISLAPNFSLRTDQQNTTTIPATVYKPPVSNPLTYRWLEGATVLQNYLPVNGSGNVDIPLTLSSVPTLSIGSHTLTLEVTDGTLTGSKTTDVLVSSAPPISGSCGSSNGQTFLSIPAENLCLTGIPSAVTGSGPWSWICGGSNGGNSTSCSASIANAAPVGTNVTVTPSPGISITFNNISVGGSVTVTPTDSLTPPANFRTISGSSYDITTTASFSGSISIGLSYSESAISSISNESRIRLYHFNGQVWEDVTTSVDTVNNIVYGRVSSLSPFILAEPTSGIPATPVGGFGMTLVTMLSIVGYGFWKSRK